MVKSYQNWVSDIANSVPDPYSNIQEKQDTKPTALQIRALFADLMVPTVVDEADVFDWLSAFSTCFTDSSPGARFMRSGWASDLIGDADMAGYHEADTDEKLVAWWKEIRRKIAQKELI